MNWQGESPAGAPKCIFHVVLFYPLKGGKNTHPRTRLCETACLLFQELVAMLKTVFGTWLVKMLKFRRAHCMELVPIAELNGVASLCKLFTCLGTKENGVSCVHLSGAVLFFVFGR